MVERTAEEPLYRQLAGELRRRITTGHYAPGDQIPSEAELQDRYGVSRVTARLATGLLKQQGLLTARSGRGTFVADPKSAQMPYHPGILHSRSARASRPGKASFAAELEAMGRTGDVRIRVKRQPAPENIADRLGLTTGEPVVVRERLHYVEGRPAFLVYSWWDAAIADGTPLADHAAVPDGSDAVMAQMGWEALSRQDEVTARMPTPEEARTLGIRKGVPVVIVVATELAQGGVPVEVYTRVMPADQWYLVYDVPKDI